MCNICVCVCVCVCVCMDKFYGDVRLFETRSRFSSVSKCVICVAETPVLNRDSEGLKSLSQTWACLNLGMWFVSAILFYILLLVNATKTVVLKMTLYFCL